MSNHALPASRGATPAVAGAAYLFMVLGGIFWWVLIGSKFVVAGEPAAAAAQVLANEQLFRVGIAYEVLMSINLIALAMSHHAMLKPSGRTLAALARWLVLTGAILAAVMVLLAFLAFQVLRAQSSAAEATAQQLGEVVGLYLNVRIAGHTISAVFLHLGMLVFLSLFLRSRRIPRSLALFGILAYGLILAAALVNIVVVGSPASMMTMQSAAEAACVVPSIVLELALGGWLLTKGLAVPPLALSDSAAGSVR